MSKQKSTPPLSYYFQKYIKQPGFAECTQLCDVGFLERVCSELVPGAFFDAAYRAANRLPVAVEAVTPYREMLLEPLMRYLEELGREHAALIRDRSKRGLGGVPTLQHGVATDEFIDVLIELIEQLENGPWDDDAATAIAQDLRFAWYKWIACVACAHMYDTIPNTVARAHRNLAKGNKEGASGRPVKEGASHKDVVNAYRRHFPARGRDTASYIAEIYGITSAWVRRLVKKDDEKKSETKPAG